MHQQKKTPTYRASLSDTFERMMCLRGHRVRHILFFVPLLRPSQPTGYTQLRYYTTLRVCVCMCVLAHARLGAALQEHTIALLRRLPLNVFVIGVCMPDLMHIVDFDNSLRADQLCHIYIFALIYTY